MALVSGETLDVGFHASNTVSTSFVGLLMASMCISFWSTSTYFLSQKNSTQTAIRYGKHTKECNTYPDGDGAIGGGGGGGGGMHFIELCFIA